MLKTSLALNPTAPQPLRLLCLGDSITDGFWFDGGYRNALCSLISAHRMESCIRFVGPKCSGTGYDPHHAGYTCYSTVDIPASISGPRNGIAGVLDALMTEYPADVVFLLIGTNDILSLYDLEHFGDRIRQIAEKILDALPQNGRLYVATLPDMDAADASYISPQFFTADSIDAAVDQCNTQIRETVQQLKAAGKAVALADAGCVLTKADLYDGVHPTEQGYAKLGSFWYGKLREYLADTQPDDHCLRQAL